MLKQDLKMIVKPFYEGLKEGKLLGRKCPVCGHIEFPPYLACNACGSLETEWVELPHKGTLTQMMPNSPVFVLPMFKEKVGEYSVGIVEIEGCDPIGTSIVGVDRERCEALQDKLPLPVKPYIYEDDGFMNVVWQLDE